MFVPSVCLAERQRPNRGAGTAEALAQPRPNLGCWPGARPSTLYRRDGVVVIPAASGRRGATRPERIPTR